jgi:hypothetical protein
MKFRLLVIKLPLCSALNIKAYKGRGVKLWHITHGEEDDKFEFLAGEKYLSVLWEIHGEKQIRPGRCVFNIFPPSKKNRDSSVGIATGYGLDDRGVGVRIAVGSRIFSSPRYPDRLWGRPSLLSSVYGGKAAGA